MADEAFALAEGAVAAALDAGASEAEATFVVADRFNVEARESAITKLERSRGRSVSLRVLRDGRKATLSTSDCRPDALARLAREAVAAAAFVAPDPHAGLPDVSADEAPGLETYDEGVAARPDEAKIDEALALESISRASDARIANSRGSRVSDSDSTWTLVNSKGFRGAHRGTSVSFDTSPIAECDGEKRVAQYGVAGRSYAALPGVEAVGREAARRAASMCGARRPPTMHAPVIFERDVAALVLGDLFSALSAANVAIGNSFLIGKVGERIGSPLATLVDDGRLPRGMGSAPFDAEGVPTRRTLALDGGVLATFFYDTYYARRLGAASTGNAAGGGAIGANNFYLAPGTQSLEQLIASTTRGVLVTDTIGFSTESVTGTYSRGARGFAIENGELAYPIDQFTVAGNLLEMLAALDAVADDLIFEATIVSPSFRVAEMTVSGT